MTVKAQLVECIRILLKTIMANFAPVTWLFLLQPLWEIKFDGQMFWMAYGAFAVLASIGMWFANRTTPDPTYRSDKEVSSPVTGLVSATFPLLTLAVVAAAYRVWGW